MALMGWEWIVAIGIIAVLILWGPKKLPELAKAIGEAKKEFSKASKEVEEAVKMEPEVEAKVKPKPSSDDLLVETAQVLGINTEGKTKEQIAQEIVKKKGKDKVTKADNP